MIKIEKLTPAQKHQLAAYTAWGRRMGFSTITFAEKDFKDYVKRVYPGLLKKPPPKDADILLAPSPKAAWEIICERSGLSPKKTNFVWPYLAGSFDSYFFAYYDYFFDVLHIENPVKASYTLYKESLSYGLLFPLDDFCVGTEKPTSIILDNQFRLHAEGRMALEYSDGFGIYALFGEKLPNKYKKFAIDPIDSLDPKEVLLIPNTVLRLAVIRRVGLHRLKSALKMKEVSRCASGILYDIDLGAAAPVRGLLLTWGTKSGEIEEVIQGVPATQEELLQFNPTLKGADLNDAESMRRLLLGFSLSDVIEEEV